MTARDPVDRPDADRAAGIFDEIAAGSDGSLTDEILMLDRPETEAAEPTVITALHAPRRRIIFAAAAVVVAAGCATLTGSLSATGSKSPRPVLQAAPQAAAPQAAAPQAAAPQAAAPQAAAPSQPTPARAEPPQTGPAKVRPAPRHKQAPTRPPVQVAAPGVLHVQPVTTRPTNAPPKQQPTTTDTHPNGAAGNSAFNQDAPPNLDAAMARVRQASEIISDASRDAAAISRIIGLPRLPNGP